MPPDGHATIFGHKWDFGKPGRGLDYQTIQESDRGQKHLIHLYPQRPLILVLTVLSSITWAQDCGWHTRDKLLYQGGPFVEFAHEDLIEIET